jgi:hypothetical protein
MAPKELRCDGADFSHGCTGFHFCKEVFTRNTDLLAVEGGVNEVGDFSADGADWAGAVGF